MPDDKIEIENISSPGRLVRVNREKYHAMRRSFLDVLPDTPPGLTEAEAKAALLPKLPESLFPGGEKAGWWLAAIRLDLEAKGIVVREKTKPLRFWRASTAG